MVKYFLCKFVYQNAIFSMSSRLQIPCKIFWDTITIFGPIVFRVMF